MKSEEIIKREQIMRDISEFVEEVKKMKIARLEIDNINLRHRLTAKNQEISLLNNVIADLQDLADDLDARIKELKDELLSLSKAS